MNLGPTVTLVDTNGIPISTSSGLPIEGSYKELAGLSAGSLNAYLVPSTDVSLYKWWSLHINTNAYVGTLTFLGSNDNINWVSINAFDLTHSSTYSPSETSQTNLIYGNACAFRYLAVQMTAYTSGAAQATLELYTVPPTWVLNGFNINGQTPVLVQNGGGTISQSNPLAVEGGFTEMAGLSAGSLNADLVASTDVSAYKWLSLHINTNAYSGTLSFQGSNDNADWRQVQFQSLNTGTMASNTTGTGALFVSPVMFRFLRVRMTSYTSGAAQGTLELYTSPAALAQYVAQSGTWNTLSANTTGGTSDYHLISAASTNANNIKVSAGQVYGYELGNNGASDAYVKLFNKASAPIPGTDTPFRTIYVPKGSRVSFHSTTGILLGTGIGVAITANMIDNDATAVAANQVSVDIDWK